MRFQCPKCGNIVLVGNNDFGTAVQCGSCSSVLTVPASRVSLGAVVGDFIIRQELGRGGMGVVYLAHQISLDRPAALKILADAYANDAEFVVGFIKEARAAAKLNHPHIVQAYAVGEDEGLFYFAMENIDGETMKSVLKREQVIPVNEAIDIIQQIAEALHYAWIEQKLIHRDIKPDNIMLTSTGRAKLADLGLARVAGDIDDTNGEEVMGTPQYISPEHLTGAPMDGRSDIYSLGATFYHFVTGRFPFDGASATEIAQKHLTAPLVSPSRVNPDVPQCVSRIIEKMMAKNPVMRYQDAEALVEDLRIAKKLIETTGGLRIRKKGKLQVDPTASVTPDDISGARIFSDDTLTRAFGPGSLEDGSRKNEKAKKSNSDLVLLGVVCALILLVVAAIVAVNFAMKKKKPKLPKKQNKTELAVKTPAPEQKTATENPADRSKEMQTVIDFVKENGNNSNAARNRCEEFLHNFDEPKTKPEQELYPKIVTYFNWYDEALMQQARKDAVINHERKLNEAADQAEKDAQKAADEQKRREEEARRQAAIKAANEKLAAKKKALEAEIAEAENESITEMMCYAIDGAFAEAAKTMGRLQDNKFEPLKAGYKDFNPVIEAHINKAKALQNLMNECAKLHASIGKSGKLLQNEKLQIDGQSVVIQKIETNAVFYKIGKAVRKKKISDLMKGYESVYEEVVSKTAEKQKNSAILFPYFAFSGNYKAAKEKYDKLPEGAEKKKANALKKDLPEMIKKASLNAKSEKKKKKFTKCEEDFNAAFNQAGGQKK